MPIYTHAIPASFLLEREIFFKYTRMPSAFHTEGLSIPAWASLAPRCNAMQCNMMQRLQYEMNECYCKEQKMKGWPNNKGQPDCAWQDFKVYEVKLRGAGPLSFCGPCLLLSSILACYAPMTPLFAKTKWDRRFGALLSIWTLILSPGANQYRRPNKIP